MSTIRQVTEPLTIPLLHEAPRALSIRWSMRMAPGRLILRKRADFWSTLLYAEDRLRAVALYRVRPTIHLSGRANLTLFNHLFHSRSQRIIQVPQDILSVLDADGEAD